jgi:hypothetical protein
MASSVLVLLTLATGAFVSSVSGDRGLTECGSSDCVKPYVWSQTAANCTEEIKTATYDCRWPSGVRGRMDEIVYSGRIAAYQIQWSSGSWSGWFVPGMNDRDSKFNPSALSCSLPYPVNGMRLAWAYFYDHKHKIVICR